MLAFLLLAPSRAFACTACYDGSAATDSDCDGYCTVDSPVADCDDADSSINADAVEVGDNGVDEDCDTHDGIARRYVSTFSSGSDWTLAGNATISGGVLNLPGISTYARATLKSNVTFLNGRPKVLVDVNSGSGVLSSCTIKLTAEPYPLGSGSPATTTTNIPSAAGVHTFDFSSSVPAPMVITKVEFYCPSFRNRYIDWISIQNGTAEWAPGGDIDLSWEDTRLPAGGANNVVIVSGADGLYTASDEGGIGWYDSSTEEWVTLNGDGVDLDAAYDVAVWDVQALDLDSNGSVETMYALTGDWYSSGTSDTLYGGLWESTDGGVNWTDLGLSELAAYGRIHACDNTGATRAGGHLTAWDDDHDWLYVASHQVGYEGVYVVDGGVATEIESAVLPDGYVSSMLLVDAGTDQQLLVGYKGDVEGDTTLWWCSVPSSATGAGDIDCFETAGWPTSGGIDVRDLQWDESGPTDRTVYVADGQKFTSGGACDNPNFGRVWEWDLDTDDLTDVTENVEGPEQSSTSYTDDEKEVLGLAMDSAGDYLYAFFAGSQDRAYVKGSYPSWEANPKVWRVAPADLDGSGSDWEGLSGTDSTTRDGNTHSLGYVSTPDTWIDDQPYPSTWAPAYAVDGVFYADGTTSTERLAVVDGFGTWLVDGATDTWSDVDDDVVWTHAYSSDNGGSILPQSTVAHDVAVTSDGVAWSALSDLGASDWDPAGSRGAEVQCIWDKFNAPGGAVDAPGTGASGEQVWLALGDSLENTGIFYSGDGGATWCYEANGDLASSSLASGTSAGCKDGSTLLSPPCNSGAELENASGPLGIPTDVLGLDIDTWSAAEGVAFATFKPDGSTGGSLAFTTDGGATWEDVTGAPADFFNVKAHVVVDPVATTYSSSSSYTMSLFVAGESNTAGEGGVSAVTWDDGDCTSGSCAGTWTEIRTSGYGCKIDSVNLSGIAANPWLSYDVPNQRIWVWGQLNYRTGTWWGGVCSVSVDDDTDQLQVVNPGSGRYYDIASVLAVPEIDRTLFIQPVVDPVTQSVCDSGSVACSRPDPFLFEVLRPLGGSYAWTSTTLITSGLEGLRGDGLEMDWVSDPYALYYVSSGNGVQTSDVTW